MKRSLGIMVNMLEAYCVEVIAQNVRTEVNLMADWLSRGQYGEAKKNVRKGKAVP